MYVGKKGVRGMETRSISIDKKLRAELQKWADKEEISLSRLICNICRDALKSLETQDAQDKQG